MKENINLPNGITLFRIVGSVVLLFLAPLSIPFFVVYTLCGISDVLDGTAARYLHTAGDFGSRLDSIADLVFYGVMLIRVLPELFKVLPMWVFGVAGLVLILRFSAYLLAGIKYRKFSSVHTYMNKLTGLAVFLIPYFLFTDYAVLLCTIVCVIGGLASLEEFLIHLTNDTYSANIRSLFF